MRHYRCFWLSLTALTFASLTSFLVVPNARANTRTSPTQLDHCIVQMVYLHGEQPPTLQCLRQEQPSGQVSIKISTTDCSNQALALRGTDNLGDLYLCFIGTGFVNLTDYSWRIVGGNWDNSANWYGTGCNTGTFYADTNGNGTQQNFSPGVQHTFDGQEGRLPSLTLSSLRISSSC
jgi:hypothetical protein